jgi:hypothetical protein
VFNFVLSLLLLSISWFPYLQGEQIEIRLKRNWGYASGAGSIQGTFTIRTSSTEDLKRVVFYLDNQPLGESGAAPFELRFVTDDFPLGSHQLHAVGFSNDGSQLQSNVIQVEFVPAGVGWRAASDILVVLLVVIIAAVGLALLVPWFFTRGKKEQLPHGAPRAYGYFGGAICPKCSRPFSRHVYGLNLGPYKFDRCPYCGKWSAVRRASAEELEAAEAAEINALGERDHASGRSKEEKLRKEIEDSRYEDL